MAPIKGATLASMLDYSEDDLDVEMPTPDSQIENKAPMKRKPGPKKAAPTTKSNVSTRRTSAGSVLSRKMAVAKKKKALAERAVLEDGNDTEEVDDFEQSAPPPKAKRGVKAAAAPVKPPAKRGRKPKIAEPEPELEEEAPVKPAKKAPAVKVTRGKRVKEPEPVIPETQPDPMDIEETEIPTEIPETDHPAPEPPKPLAQRATTGGVRSISRQPEPLNSRHRRGGSASDTERAGEPALRRKLGDITKKFENLDLKYRNLKELGTIEAQSNFDKLRKSCDHRAKDQEEIIASLKRELSNQKSIASESRRLQTQLQSLQSENMRLQTENKTLSSSLATAQSSLKASENEGKTLQAKLTTLRNSKADAPAKTVPGSAVKARGGVAAGKNAVASETEEKMKTMMLKEEMYSDLTGLMIHTVKKDENEDIYDCIQTGRNGTLRFHLYISHNTANPSTTSTPGNVTAYEDEEFAYLPILDQKNDRHLLEILPDYLQEEISFPRNAAPKFYEKIAKLMNTVFED
ncbi:Monopolin complex subunit pcs1 [Venturia nashicola]|uniref:Monopolin complex subunit pcs1 n=1 Tax=Venturia nashicola TaxID=86259 RepID=A0A4Z1P4A8_9PEZI|nr:Monopolin complex subunit pcs1 [Venturia nashicola]TLD36342.1 Monopolin complex subunit pcs1 [Venturia nashicola]